MNHNLLILLIISNVPIIFFLDKIIKKFNINDKSDGIRKFQKNPIALFGGSIFFYNIFLIIFIEKIVDLNFINDFTFSTNRELIAFGVGLFSFFMIGLYDDKYNLNPYKKIALSTLAILLVINLDQNVIIRELDFSFFDHTIELRSFSYFFTILCFLLFINALNMFDGINLQVGCYSLIVCIILISNGIFSDLNLILIFSLLIFLFYNYKNKIYLGDSGVYLLAFLFSYFFINSHNNSEIFLADEIFVIMFLPGVDMLRLFLTRVTNGKNPFEADSNHLHHLLLKKYSPKFAFCFSQIIILICIIGYYYVTFKTSFLLSIIFFYILIIIFLKKK
jgi:UDP-GlcNAc:undecaprenyl-phosphate GlcNAc-1-phosphate transferase